MTALTNQALALAIGMALWVGQAVASVIPGTLVGTGYGHAQVDSQSGRVYTHDQYYGNAGTFGYYASVADFEEKSGFTAVTVSGAMPWGSYFGAVGDVIIARSDGTSNRLRTFNGLTGQEIRSGTAISGYCGANVSCGFNWGGFSAMNILQDQTGTYLLGADAITRDWVLSRITTDLEVTEVARFGRQNNTGYAFMMGGTLFMGRSYNGLSVPFAYDTLTNTFSDPGLVVEQPDPFIYRASAFYDAGTDALYIANGSEGTNSTIKVGTAMNAFGVAPISSVPLPSGGLLLLSVLAAMAGVRRLRAA